MSANKEQNLEKKKEDKSGTGLRPVNNFQATRRNLPHWQYPGSVYFITWRIKGNGRFSPEEKTIILKSLLYWNDVKWTIYAAVVMPNHAHVIAQPMTLEDGSAINLSEIIRSKNQLAPGLLMH